VYIKRYGSPFKEGFYGNKCWMVNTKCMAIDDSRVVLKKEM
jgi:hypothetical protein